MAALYPRWSNTVYRLALLGILLGAASAIAGPMLYVRSTYNTSQFTPYEQPVEFDHRHHARDDGIECLYCHSAAERSSNAGVPSTGVCMGCHAQVYKDSPLLATVRQSYFTGTPINWKRVHDLPDFVYFDHSVHIARGFDCSACHGDVGMMARVEQVQPLTMGWCIDCHTVEHTTLPNDAWEASMQMLITAPTRKPEITSLVTCTACHR
ncbi:MAG: cytochrome c3 family protein [Deltaproteobacteria bacterium]|nr:cytochrome c3 family protein [Deltaproteobacteria bacterium]MCW5808830.1 cytochrome c3 family protein [Deltaproteobacteria bacterium]